MGGQRVRRSVAGAGFTAAALLLSAQLWGASVPGGEGAAAAATGNAPGVATSVAVGADHDCIVSGSGTPKIAWSQLHNPILSYSNAAAKDEALIWYGHRWHMLFSYVTHDRSYPGGVRWNIATAISADLAHWSAPSIWPTQEGAVGVASPDIVREPTGLFVVTYQSNPPQHGQDKLFYRTSADLVHWSNPHPLAPGVAPAADDRQIDPALAFTGHGVILGFKASTGDSAQHFENSVVAKRITAGALDCRRVA